MLYVILIILNIIILSILYYNYKKKLQQKIEIESKKYIEENVEIFKSTAFKAIDGLKLQKQEIQQEIEKKWTELKIITNQIEFSTKQLNEISNTLTIQRESAKTYEEDLRKSAREVAKTYEADLLKIADARVEEEKQKMQKAAQASFEKTMADMGAQTEAARAQIEVLTKEIAEYSAKQAAINEAILRQRALEEQQDFYRICLTPEAKSDINYLISIIPNLKNPTILYKLIWSEYIQKQFNQMLKNVLGATDPRNVIYSITNLKTNEIYIGKTKAEVSKRWSEHIKSSLNIGTIKSAKIHQALYNHWDEFVFAVVEKVPLEENLSIREKFYIDFYQSNIYGYNLKSGG